LPLPTTGNTQSLYNYTEYHPTEEWAPGPEHARKVLIWRILNALGGEDWQDDGVIQPHVAPPQPEQRLRSSVTALDRRGVHVPVKKAPKRRAATQDPDSDEVSSENSPTPRPVKKEKTSQRQSRLDRIISGQILTRSRQEATEAHRERKTRHQQGDSKEFFAIEDEDDEDEAVRCICGANVDDNKAFVCCDGCGVWQHNDCMGAGVPENLEENEYRCQVCDPWAHRVLLKGLRAEEEVVNVDRAGLIQRRRRRRRRRRTSDVKFEVV
jgi:hypothetical protein